MPAGLDVAIVGMGPRGLSVLERLLVRLAEQPVSGQVRIWTFDPGEQGAGRIWRTTQPEWFMMNTTAGEVSVYSGGPDGGEWRAGAGPSLAEWLQRHPDPRWAALGPNDYAPRSVYGEYLRNAFDCLVANAPSNVKVRPVTARVDRIDRSGPKRILRTEGSDYSLTVDKVVLTTGHPRIRPGTGEQRLIRFAERNPGSRYLPGDSAADLDLDGIKPGEDVGIVGLGLTFLDVLMALTIGRGGQFEELEDGGMRYRRSGLEPRIVAGSRSGLVMPARGRNQKSPGYRYQPRFATEFAIASARRRAQRTDGSAQLDFLRDVLPLLELEAQHVYYTTHVRRRRGEQAAEEFAARHRQTAGTGEQAAVDKLLTEFGVADVPSIDLARLARPFRDEQFRDQGAFHDRLISLLREDIAEAEQGNLDSPLKAALDILRDIRASVRQAVDFGGLRADSHRDDFLSWFNPINTMVSAGPPGIRVAQACALIESGTLTVAGPDMRISCERRGGRFVLWSPQVRGGRHAVSTLIDARIPRPQLDRDADPLIEQLLADGLISEYVNVDPVTSTRFNTGAVAVSRAPFRVIGAGGSPDPHLYALGVPTENARWFTQIGNGRPGPLTGFHADADAIARDVLGVAACRTVPARSADAEPHQNDVSVAS
ncbi:FAD/NAD(P)-binding protein [Actinophytocola sp.]|uniref:FAD/NAD(P)-binding protein n=1 Tax=Actinophytocola sp. TaxID=1872138 RepID=UPI002ED02314